MPEIIPFKGYRYNPDKIKRYEDVLTPPYDVISKKDQNEFYKRSRYNFVRLDLRKTAGGNHYTKAAKEMKAWIAAGVLKPEDKPAVYVYEQEYRDLKGKTASRIGVLSLMKIDTRKVKKHENTLEGPKEDRLKLMKSMDAQLSPLFGLIKDASGEAHKLIAQMARKEPVFDVRSAGVRHRLFMEDDPKRINLLRRILKSKNMYIADGHHRFEVACRYHAAKKNGAASGPAYVLTYLCDSIKNDFTIYPTHRVLSALDKGWEADFEKIARRFFKLENFSSLGALLLALEKKSEGFPAVGFFREGSYGKLTLKRSSRDLDVSILDRYFVRKLIPEGVAKSDRIRFVRDARETAAVVRSRKADIAFFLSKMPIDEMIRVSDAGIKLPQKSTYFYPKLLSGMVLHKF